MKKIMIVSLFVLALFNASAECGDMHSDRSLVASNPTSASAPTEQEKKVDISDNEDEKSTISFLDYIQIQIIQIIQ